MLKGYYYLDDSIFDCSRSWLQSACLLLECQWWGWHSLQWPILPSESSGCQCVTAQPIRGQPFYNWPTGGKEYKPSHHSQCHVIVSLSHTPLSPPWRFSVSYLIHIIHKNSGMGSSVSKLGWDQNSMKVSTFYKSILFCKGIQIDLWRQLNGFLELSLVLGSWKSQDSFWKASYIRGDILKVLMR